MVTHTALVQDGDKDSPTLGVDLSLIPVESSIYDWDETTDEGSVPTVGALTLPGQSDLGAPTSLALESDSTTSITRPDGSVHSQILVTWTAPAEQTVLSGGHIEVWVKATADTDFRLDGRAAGSDTFYYINRNIVDNVSYDVMLVAVASTNVRSASVTDSVTCSGAVSFDHSQFDGLVNANFEASSTMPTGAPPGWQTNGGGTLSYETSTQQSGTRSLKVVASVQFGGVTAVKTWKVTPGEQYKIGGYSKTVSSKTAWIQLQFIDASGSLTAAITCSTTSSSWTSLSDSAVVPAGSVYARFFCVCQSVGGGTVYFDNLSMVRVSSLDDEVADGSTYHRVPKNGQRGGTSVVNAVTSVTATITSPVTSSNTFTVPGFVNAQAYTAGGLIDIVIDCGSGTGYVFRLDARTSLPLAQLYRASTVTSTGTWAAIGTTPANNAAALTGWFELECYVGPNGYFCMYINGNVLAEATDTTYTPTGTIKYGRESVNGKLAPGLSQKGGSTSLNGQGSLANISDYTFSYAATTGTITWSWGAFSIYRPDGSIISVGSGSQTGFGGLSHPTTYYFGMYYDLLAGTPVVVKSDVTSGTAPESIAQIAQVINGDNNVPIAVSVTAATPSSGTGGGGGGGGGAGCFSPETRLIDGRCIGDIKVGDVVTVQKDDGRRVQRPVAHVLIHDFDGNLLDMRDGLVTFRHHLRSGDKWVPAEDVYDDEVRYVGKVWNLHIATDVDDERNFVLHNGQVAHNIVKK